MSPLVGSDRLELTMRAINMFGNKLKIRWQTIEKIISNKSEWLPMFPLEGYSKNMRGLVAALARDLNDQYSPSEVRQMVN